MPADTRTEGEASDGSLQERKKQQTALEDRLGGIPFSGKIRREIVGFCEITANELGSCSDPRSDVGSSSSRFFAPLIEFSLATAVRSCGVLVVLNRHSVATLVFVQHSYFVCSIVKI